MFSASAKLSVNVILFFVVFPPKTISSPVPAASTLMLSAFISPTFVMLLSPNDNAPAKAVIVTEPIVPPFIWLPLIVSALICPAIVSAVIEPPNAVDAPAIVIASEAN